jgi:hypothetical protein
VQEVELGQVQQRRLAEASLEGEVELLERLSVREARGADAKLAARGLAALELGGKERFGEALVAPLALAGALAQARKRPRRPGRLERPEDVSELGGLAHPISAS